MKRTKLTRRTPLRRVSKKLAASNVLYREAKASWWKHRQALDGGRCEFEMDGMRCTAQALPNPHHKKGRAGPLLYDQEFFMACCWTDHDFIERNKTWARSVGFILYK